MSLSSRRYLKAIRKIHSTHFDTKAQGMKALAKFYTKKHPTIVETSTWEAVTSDLSTPSAAIAFYAIGSEVNCLPVISNFETTVDSLFKLLKSEDDEDRNSFYYGLSVFMSEPYINQFINYVICSDLGEEDILVNEMFSNLKDFDLRFLEGLKLIEALCSRTFDSETVVFYIKQAIMPVFDCEEFDTLVDWHISGESASLRNLTFYLARIFEHLSEIDSGFVFGQELLRIIFRGIYSPFQEVSSLFYGFIADISHLSEAHLAPFVKRGLIHLCVKVLHEDSERAVYASHILYNLAADDSTRKVLWEEENLRTMTVVFKKGENPQVTANLRKMFQDNFFNLGKEKHDLLERVGWMETYRRKLREGSMNRILDMFDGDMKDLGDKRREPDFEF